MHIIIRQHMPHLSPKLKLTHLTKCKTNIRAWAKQLNDQNGSSTRQLVTQTNRAENKSTRFLQNKAGLYMITVIFLDPHNTISKLTA